MSGTGFVRAPSSEFVPQGDAMWFVFEGHMMLVRGGDTPTHVPVADSSRGLGIPMAQTQYIGKLDGTPCIAARSACEGIPDGYSSYDLRGLYGLVPEPEWVTAGVAYQLLEWIDNSRFCPRTGEPTHWRPGEWAMQCSSCDHLQYPPLHPCIIVLVHDGDRILLTRQSSWPPERYGLVAGFVEPGETLEQCLAREVREETNVRVGEIRYFASQPWPFPHQLMVGFTAHYASGQIVVDPLELEDARWFSIDDLPKLPPPLSIARRIIDAHIATFKVRHR